MVPLIIQNLILKLLLNSHESLLFVLQVLVLNLLEKVTDVLLDLDLSPKFLLLLHLHHHGLSLNFQSHRHLGPHLFHRLVFLSDLLLRFLDKAALFIMLLF